MSYRKIAARRSRGQSLFATKPVVKPLAVFLAALSSPAFAQSAHTELAPVVVTANPLGSGLFDMVTPVTVVNQPVVYGWDGNTLYQQAYPALEDDKRNQAQLERQAIQRAGKHAPAGAVVDAEAAVARREPVGEVGIVPVRLFDAEEVWMPALPVTLPVLRT